MIDNIKVKKIYKQIQQRLYNMIPEKWEAIYLYASIIQKIKGVEVGEMFFYYCPKGVIKKKPVNVYEIPRKFNIDEEDYSILINKLYEEIKKLREEFKIDGSKIWKSITIKIENCKFIVEYYYTDFLEKKYPEDQMHLIWKYKNLGYKLEQLNKKDKQIIQDYLNKEQFEEKQIYEENVYQKQLLNRVKYNSTKTITKYKKEELK